MPQSEEVASLERLVFAAIDTESRVQTLSLNCTREAIETARCSMERRLDAMNEFRGALSDMGARMITRSEGDAAHGLINDRLERIRAAVQVESEAASALTQRVTATEEAARSFRMMMYGLGGLVITVLLAISGQMLFFSGRQQVVLSTLDEHSSRMGSIVSGNVSREQRFQSQIDNMQDQIKLIEKIR